MKNTVYIFVFDGFADWEPALALCEINKQEKFRIISAGIATKPVISMGGLKILPEITLPEIKIEKASLFILPGGEMWEKEDFQLLNSLLSKLQRNNVPVAAICGATLALMKAGLIKKILHTSNSKEYLKAMIPDYKEESYYRDELAVCDKNIVTASGAGYVEFAREILSILNIYNEDEMKIWFDLFKHGILPGTDPSINSGDIQ